MGHPATRHTGDLHWLHPQCATSVWTHDYASMERTESDPHPCCVCREPTATGVLVGEHRLDGLACKGAHA